MQSAPIVQFHSQQKPSSASKYLHRHTHSLALTEASFVEEKRRANNIRTHTTASPFLQESSGSGIKKYTRPNNRLRRAQTKGQSTLDTPEQLQRLLIDSYFKCQRFDEQSIQHTAMTSCLRTPSPVKREQSPSKEKLTSQYPQSALKRSIRSSSTHESRSVQQQQQSSTFKDQRLVQTPSFSQYAPASLPSATEQISSAMAVRKKLSLRSEKSAEDCQYQMPLSFYQSIFGLQSGTTGGFYAQRNSLSSQGLSPRLSSIDFSLEYPEQQLPMVNESSAFLHTRANALSAQYQMDEARSTFTAQDSPNAFRDVVSAVARDTFVNSNSEIAPPTIFTGKSPANTAMSREDCLLRVPSAYTKKGFLGRGKYSHVYLLSERLSGKTFAGKLVRFKGNPELQAQTSQHYRIDFKQCEKVFHNELQILKKFFYRGTVREHCQKCLGAYRIPRLYAYFYGQSQGWLVSHYAGRPLNRALFDVKRESLQGDQVYRITLTRLYRSLMMNPTNLCEIVRDLAHALELLASNDIVHADLRLDNVVVKTEDYGDGEAVEETHLVDFSSAFSAGKIDGLSNIIPEYMPPELLTYIASKNAYNNSVRPQRGQQKTQYYDTRVPWAIDVWSLGCLILEIVSAVPLWMPHKSLIGTGADHIVRSGIFVVRERALDKIVEKQEKFVKQLDKNLRRVQLFSLNDKLRSVLHGALAIDPLERISPARIIQLLN